MQTTSLKRQIFGKLRLDFYMQKLGETNPLIYCKYEIEEIGNRKKSIMIFMIFRLIEVLRIFVLSQSLSMQICYSEDSNQVGLKHKHYIRNTETNKQKPTTSLPIRVPTGMQFRKYICTIPIPDNARTLNKKIIGKDVSP